MKRRTFASVWMVVVLVVVTGCGPGGFSGFYTTPLPGGADVGNHPYTVTVQFNNVADLVPQAAVKVNDVPVGRVSRIELADDNHTVDVTVLINGSVELPANAVGGLRQSSLLGEKFIELAHPKGEESRGKLTDGAVIGLDRTDRSAEVEEVLGALSLLLNGGGIDQIRTITTELNSAMSGNEKEIRSLLSNVETLTSTLDDQRKDITRALDGLAELSGSLDEQRGTIKRALADLPPGLKVLADQRDDFVRLLTSINRLSDVAVDTVKRSKDDLVADLRALASTLRKLAEAGTALPKSLEILATFPLTDAGLDIIKGDYANAKIRADFKLDSLLTNLNSPNLGPEQRSAAVDLPLPRVVPPPMADTRSGLDTAPGIGNGPGGLIGSLLGGT